MRKLGAALMLMACASAVHAQDAVIGLLALPEVFGSGACDAFTPSEVALYPQPAPSAAPLGTVKVDQYWTFHDDGGCEGLAVHVHLGDTPAAAPLPVREYAYEAPGAVVVERRGSWYRIRLASGTGWVRTEGEAHFEPLETLLAANPAYLVDPAGAALAPAPGGTPGAVGDGPGPAWEVRVLDSIDQDGSLWLHVEVLSHSVCEGGAEPVVVAQGWLPAHDPEGEPAVWFRSRGC